MKKIDYILLGSDTIWDLSSRYFIKNYRKYFGGIFEGKKVFSYAAASVIYSKMQQMPTILLLKRRHQKKKDSNIGHR